MPEGSSPLGRRGEADRYCRCGTRLARDNPGALCAACRRRLQEAKARPPQVPAEFWLTAQMRDALASRHLGRVVRAWRRHPFHGPRPLPQELVAGWLGITQAQLSRIENGPPIRDFDRLIHWARVLGIPPGLLWFELPSSVDSSRNGEPSADDVERYTLAVQDPARVDAAIVGYLTRVLAEHRRADDLFGPRSMLPVISGQMQVIESFITAARPRVRRQVLYVACQYAQLLGWMHQDAGQHKKAAHWYDRAAEWALESENLPMVATCLSMKADQAWTHNQPYRAISLAQAAQRDEWRSPPGLRALITHQEATGHALAATLTGESAEIQAALRSLDEIAGWVEAMQERRVPEVPWTYFYTPDFSRLQRANVLRHLGRVEEAIPLYLDGLARLEAGHKRERGQYLARLSVAYMLAGDADAALAEAEKAAAIARDVGSLRTAEELRRLHGQASEHNATAALRRLEDLLRSIAEPADTE